MAMTFAYPLPRSHYEHPTVDVRSTPVGTGAFILDPDDWEPGCRSIFERNSTTTGTRRCPTPTGCSTSSTWAGKWR